MFVHLRECSDILFNGDTDTDEVLTCVMCSNHRMARHVRWHFQSKIRNYNLIKIDR